MASANEPRRKFGHLQDYWTYEANVRAGRLLCERCDGGGNELWSMWKACSDCGGSGVDPNWTPPAPPEPMGLSPIGGASCPASWPEWATTEDGELVWVRADLEGRAAEVAAPALDADDGLVLERRGRVAMALELENTEWGEDWLLVEVALEADPQDAIVYVEYEVVYADEESAMPSDMGAR